MSDKKIDAWMPFWIGDYLADTMTLTRDQHGGYFLLLLAYWRNRGPLPDDDEELAAITRASPDEWAKLRGKLARFFTVADGLWSHGRADKELAEATKNRAAAVQKAKAGANAKWEKAKAMKLAALASSAPSNAPSTTTSSASSTAQALPEQCPSPSPSPVVVEPNGSTPTMGGGLFTEGEYTGPGDPTPDGTAYGSITKRLRALGMPDAHHGNQSFRLLVDAGATLVEFEAYAPEALKKSAPFKWLLAAIAGERERAAATSGVIHHGPLVVATAAKSADSAANADVARTQALLASQAAVTSSPEVRKAAMAKMQKTREEVGGVA